MNTKYWMISNRNETRRVRAGRRGHKALGGKLSPELSYWVADQGPLDRLESWTKTSLQDFKRALIAQSLSFPLIQDLEDHEREKHVTLFIHGYNNGWEDAARRYEQLCRDLFESEGGMGVCVLFTWPSNGMTSGYYPDRRDARRSADHLAEVLNNLYDYLVRKQDETDEEKRCRAKTSIIAHSMGNYVLEEAMRHCWNHNNRPLLVSLVNQLIMVAADVDNDLFRGGEHTDGSGGDAIAQLTYRVTSLYTGRDQVLGMSAGFKHFGKRRLGRSGLDCRYDVPDNVWDIDCSDLIPRGERNIHSAYFEAKEVLQLIKQLLRGVDRHELLQTSSLPLRRSTTAPPR